jgi:hypothetical protein
LIEGNGVRVVGRIRGIGVGVLGVEGNGNDFERASWFVGTVGDGVCGVEDEVASWWWVNCSAGTGIRMSPDVSRESKASRVSMQRFLAAVDRSRGRRLGLDNEIVLETPRSGLQNDDPQPGNPNK